MQPGALAPAALDLDTCTHMSAKTCAILHALHMNPEAWEGCAPLGLAGLAGTPEMTFCPDDQKAVIK